MYALDAVTGECFSCSRALILRHSSGVRPPSPMVPFTRATWVETFLPLVCNRKRVDIHQSLELWDVSFITFTLKEKVMGTSEWVKQGVKGACKRASKMRKWVV